ncbi:MAG TPA: hypothetical protein VGC37_05035 [Friedmanniella sp.]
MAALSRGMKIFLVVDVVLVVALAVAAILILGGGGSGSDDAADGATASQGTATTPATGSTAGAAATPGSAATSTEAQTFASPSGNISCTMSVDGVTCSIAHITYAPPVVEGCTGTTGHVIVLNTADGATTPCVDGPDPAVASADVPVLEYGRTQTVGPYTCTSATDGMTCVVDESAAGFQVATAAMVLLP